MKKEFTYVDFIEDSKLQEAVKHVLTPVRDEEVNRDFFENTIDPFSALFDSSLHGLTLDQWFKSEKSRQIQKTMQNYVGEFHQMVLGGIDGWKDLGVGEVVDLCNSKEKMIAEIKNKYNTTKGNHKVAIYDDFKTLLAKPTYASYTAYYVEVLPRNGRTYNKPFTPSDNRSSSRRPIDEKIRVIDGKSFYELATGQADAIKELYKALPRVISDVLGHDITNVSSQPMFNILIDKVFPG